MRYGPSICAVALAVSATTQAIAGPPASSSAREWFAEGQFSTAAAAFERDFKRSKRGSDGLNAVVSWRSAGRYAHARILIDQVLPTLEREDLRTRARVIADRLDQLTGSLVLSGAVRDGSSVTVDGAPAESFRGKFLVNVGRRQVRVAHPDCAPFSWQGTVLPAQVVQVEVRMQCKPPDGSLHVTLSGAAGAHARIDGRSLPFDSFDLDTRVAPGRHRLVVERNGINLADRLVDIRSEKKTFVDVRVPMRAKGAGLIAGVSTSGWAGPLGATVGTALALGYHIPMGQSPTGSGTQGIIQLEMGYASTTVGRGWSGFAFGMLAGYSHVYPPALQARTGAVSWILDFEPLLFRGNTFSHGDKDRYFTYSEQVFHFGFLPVVLTAELPWLHTELAFFPVGFTRHAPWSRDFSDTPSDYSYTFGLSLTAAQSFLGN